MTNSTVEMAFKTAFTCGRTVAVDIISTPEQLLLLILWPFQGYLGDKTEVHEKGYGANTEPENS